MSLSTRALPLRQVLVERDVAAFVLAIGLTLVHILYDAFVEGSHHHSTDQPQRGLVQTAICIGLVLLYPRLGGVGRARMALVLGVLGVVGIVGMHVTEAVRDGVTAGFYVAGLALVGSALLVILGATLSSHNRDVATSG